MTASVAHPTAYSISAARPKLGDIVRRAAHRRERIGISDNGTLAVVVISAAELEELEDRAAWAEYAARKAAGTMGAGVPLADARTALGLDAA